MSINNLSTLRKYGSIGIDLDSKHLQFILNTGFDLSSFVKKALDDEMEYYEWCMDNQKVTKELVTVRDELRNTEHKISEAVENLSSLYIKSIELENDITEILYSNSKEWREEINVWRSHYEPVNRREEGQEFHHMHLNINGKVDKKIGIYIPKELHRSIHHNSSTKKGIKKINKAALLWLCEQATI
ncbi:MAG: hypothetical protein PHX62_05940 [Bacilli bacterium]|nr:hypothetical protein [Bacilli bacterium]